MIFGSNTNCWCKDTNYWCKGEGDDPLVKDNGLMIDRKGCFKLIERTSSLFRFLKVCDCLIPTLECLAKVARIRGKCGRPTKQWAALNLYTYTFTSPGQRHLRALISGNSCNWVAAIAAISTNETKSHVEASTRLNTLQLPQPPLNLYPIGPAVCYRSD